ncbi:inositol monophosphatase family protein [Halorubrum sp. DTA98]|uniref:inositol monophosphatase family protein n=1 Tax=Halorubrum sp. DTA98 TaxID=3402163 RepID=UPI003AAA89A7
MDESGALDALIVAAEEGASVALDGFRTELDVETKSGRFDRVTRIDRAAQRRVAESLASVAPDVPLVGEEGDARKDVPAEGYAWVVDPIDGTNNYVAGGGVWAVAVAATRDGEPVAAVTHLPVVGDTYTAAALDGSRSAVGKERVDDAPSGTEPVARRNGEPIRVSDREDPSSFTINPVFGFSDRARRHHRRAIETIFEEFGDYRRVGCAQSALASVASGELDAAVSTVQLDPWDTVGGVGLVRAAGGTVTDVHGNRWVPGATGLVASNGSAHRQVVQAFSPERGRA